MALENQKDKLLESAQIYLQLGKLLKKKRTSWANREVEKIVSLKVSDEEKVRKIQKVDEAVIKQKKILQRQKSGLKKEKSTKTQSEKAESLPEKLYKENYLIYLLFHHKKICRFGRKTQTLKAVFPSFAFRLHPQVGLSLYAIQMIIQELLDPLIYLVEEGWMVLTKEEYNLTLAFYDFCDQYFKEFIKDFDYTDLILVQKQFFIVTQKERYRELLYESIRKGLENHHLFQSKVEELVEKVKMIIEIDKMTPSLTNILLAIQMQDLNKFYRLSDLIYTEDPPFIKKNSYLASDEIMKKIDHYLREKEQLLSEKEKEVQFLAFITEKFIPNWKKHSFSFLRKFCFVEGIDDKSNLKKQINDLAQFVFVLLKQYLKVFNQFTLNKISLVTTDNKVIQEKIIPYALDPKLRMIQEEYRFLTDFLRKVAIGKISFTRYQEYIENKIPVTENEGALFTIIKNFPQTFYEIALHLYQNIAFENKLSEIPIQKRLELVKDEDIFEKTIPYANGRLNLNYYLSNKTVLEAYFDLMEFSLNFALFFLNQELIRRLELQPKLAEEISRLSQLILRMKQHES